MTWQKRILDLICASVLLVALAPIIAIICLLILIFDGRPIFFISDRARSVDTTFRLVKFRTMRPDPSDFGASGGHKSHRITRTGPFLRRTRIDEIPQLWNIIRGDMSFVGPRPPLETYAKRYPEIYAEVLKSRPGVTGMASLYFHKHEEYLLRNCNTVDENEEVYTIRCIPRKANLDLIYAKNKTVCLDIWLMLATVIPRLR